MSSARGIKIEICCDSYRSAMNAEEGGADRIELCDNLEMGGTTPSYGLIKQVMRNIKIPVHVLIRPRPGNFVYDEDEMAIMLEDIHICKDLGVNGVVVGILKDNLTVDLPRTKSLVDAAKPLTATFHRAFDDVTGNLNLALEDVINTGCTRLLTCGGRGFENAEQGRENLRKLNDKAEGRIKIMPGAGIRPENVATIVKDAEVKEIHASVTEKVEDKHESRFGSPPRRTSKDRVHALAQVLEETCSNDTDHLYMSAPRLNLHISHQTCGPPWNPKGMD